VCVGDREIVAAILAGDPAGLAAAYSAYADLLYTYCRGLVHEPEDAADALQDTFVVAAQKVGGLRDPDRLRPWLYAVARNECLRRLRARTRTVGLAEAGDVTDESVDPIRDLHREELRGLVRAALDGLNPSEREVLDLSVRHEFDGAGLGAVLGVSANHAHALLSRARGQLEKALGALLVARRGSADCGELAQLLGDWDGRFTPLVRKRVNRHIEHCDVCRERRGVELNPAVLLGLGPILFAAPRLREQVLRLCSDDTPQSAAHRAQAAGNAQPFDEATGFPLPLDQDERSESSESSQSSQSSQSSMDAAARRRRTAVYTLIAALIFLLLGTFAAAAFRVGPFTRAAAIRSARIAVATSTAQVSITATPSLSLPASTLGPSPDASTYPHTPSTAADAESPTTTPGTPAIVVTLSAPPPNPTPTPPPPTSPRSTPSPTSSLEASETPVVMDGPRVTGHFEITAEGGTVDYTITLPTDPARYGDPVVSPPSGTLTAGQSVTEAVKITDSSAATEYSFDVVIDPGNITVSITWA
jgi:RNA polymerase sigma factor (sigma-70 family)